MRTINSEKAKAAGYRALTNPYQLPQEQAMLDGVVADMRRGNIGHVLVKDERGISVWRSFRSGTKRAGTVRSATLRMARPSGRAERRMAA